MRSRYRQRARRHAEPGTRIGSRGATDRRTALVPPAPPAGDAAAHGRFRGREPVGTACGRGASGTDAGRAQRARGAWPLQPAPPFPHLAPVEPWQPPTRGWRRPHGPRGALLPGGCAIVARLPRMATSQPRSSPPPPRQAAAPRCRWDLHTPSAPLCSGRSRTRPWSLIRRPARSAPHSDGWSTEGPCTAACGCTRLRASVPRRSFAGPVPTPPRVRLRPAPPRPGAGGVRARAH